MQTTGRDVPDHRSPTRILPWMGAHDQPDNSELIGPPAIPLRLSDGGGPLPSFRREIILPSLGVLGREDRDFALCFKAIVRNIACIRVLGFQIRASWYIVLPQDDGRPRPERRATKGDTAR